MCREEKREEKRREKRERRERVCSFSVGEWKETNV
jgi:hypothetical protein